jgi:hypothetical protein
MKPARPVLWTRLAPLEATTSGSAALPAARHWAAGGVRGSGAPEAAKARVAAAADRVRLVDEDAPEAAALPASSYQADLCAGHRRVGRRGVAPGPAAAAATREARAAAQRNRAAGAASNVRLADEGYGESE